MSVKKQILSLVIIATELIANIGYCGVISLTYHEQKTDELNHAVIEVKSVYEIQHNFQMLGLKFDELYESQDTIRASSLVGELVVIRNDVQQTMQNITCPDCKLVIGQVDKELAGLTPLVSKLKVAFAKGDYDEARDYKKQVNESLSNVAKLLSSSTDMTAALADRLRRESHNTYYAYRLLLIMTSVIMIVFCFSITFLMMRGLLRSVTELNSATREFTDGNRQRRVNAKMPLEFSQLADSFNQMACTIESSEETTATMNRMLSQEVGVQRDRLKMAHRQTKQRMQEIAAYLGLAKALTSSLSIDEILDRSVATLKNVFDADYMVAGLVDENSLSHCWEVEACGCNDCPAYKSTNLECWTLNRTSCRNQVQDSFTDKIQECVSCKVFQNTNMSVHAASGENLDSVIGFEIPVFSSVCGQALLKLKPEAIEDLPTECKLVSLNTLAPDCISQVSVPLITNNRVLGTMIFGYKQKHTFSKDELDLIHGLCQQIAIAVDNARLFNQTTRAARDSSVLYKAGQALNSLSEEQAIAHVFLSYALELMNAESGIVYLANGKNKSIKKAVCKQISKQVRDALWHKDGTGFISEAIKERTPLLIDERYTQQDDTVGTVKSAVVSPMFYNNVLLGAVAITSPSHRIFTYSDLEMLSTLTGLAATAIHNTYMLKELEQLYIDTVKAFVQAIEAKDSYTRGHSENVASYATAIAQHMNLSPAKVKALETAALLHDIGKIGIREDILNKPGRLTEEEYEYIKLHPHISYQILRHVPKLKTLAKVVLHHHEKYDGSGYLDGLSGNDIPFEARILAVADAFDAMTSSRPYREPASIEQARDELLKNSGTQFDPVIVKAFLELIDAGEIEIPDELTEELNETDDRKTGAQS